MASPADPGPLGLDRRVLPRRLRPVGARHHRCARKLLSARPGPRSSSGVWPSASTTGGALLFSAAVRRQRLQAIELVSSMDGSSRRARSRRLVPSRAGKAHRAARHPRHPRRTLPAADAIYKPGMGDGARHHRDAQTPGSRRSGQVRLRAVSPRHDERLRVQSCAG
jgi:hypothetical protein